jgi:hypothetical protein
VIQRRGDARLTAGAGEWTAARFWEGEVPTHRRVWASHCRPEIWGQASRALAGASRPGFQDNLGPLLAWHGYRCNAASSMGTKERIFF